MHTFLKNSAIILALAGTAIATAATAGAGGVFVGFGSDRGDHRSTTISVGFNNIAFGYRDGYWDRGHRWHRWSNDRDHRSYRRHNSSHYRDWNHDRYGGDGWARDGNFGFGEIAFGYRDGYWDNGHRWHQWSNDHDYRDYRRHNAGSYRDWNHDRDGSDGWKRDADRGRDGGRRH